MEQISTGKFISQIRKEKGLTQRQLADELNISDKTISKWECDKGLPEVSLMIPLCTILGINVNELLSGKRLSEIDYKQKAEENMLLLLEEKEQKRRNSILNLLETTDFNGRLSKNITDGKYDEIISYMCEICECAMNNGLFGIADYTEKKDTPPFLKEMIYHSVCSQNLLSADEIFDTFSIRIRLSNLCGCELIGHLIMLQGYLYILQGTTTDKIREKLQICFSN